MGSDFVLPASFTELGGFNSRSRVGSDDFAMSELNTFGGFNSRSRVGSDVLHLDVYAYEALFQFALPRGERRHECRP